MTHPNYSHLLSDDNNAKIILTTKQTQEFVSNHMNRKGEPKIAVDGLVRHIRWKSKGAGFCTVWTEAMVYDEVTKKLI